MAVDKSLISGSTTLLILSLLEEKDMYGYEMIDTLKGKSNKKEWKEYSEAILQVIGGVCFGTA